MAELSTLKPLFMKKTLLFAAAAAVVATASAQQPVEHTNFGSNWSLGVNGGVTTPLTHHAFFGSMRGTFGLDLHKQISYVFGLGVEGSAAVNTSSWDINMKPFRSNTAIDASYVGVYGDVNLANLFLGYGCDFRHFGLRAQAGAGWGHNYWAESQRPDENYFVTKAGLSIDWNVNRALTLSLKPSIAWNMTGGNIAMTTVGYNANNAAFNCAVQVTYNFGKGFPCVNCAPDMSGEVAALNARVNELRGQVDQANALAASNATRANALAAELEACKNRKPEVVKEVNNNLNSVRYVFYKLGSSVITADQQPNVEMIAAYMKNHPNSKVVIKGYASPDGNLENNIKLAQRRAESVKTALVNRYKINANRIQAEGEGIGNMFSEESWNRVSICTIED